MSDMFERACFTGWTSRVDGHVGDPVAGSWSALVCDRSREELREMVPAEETMALWRGVVAGFDGTPQARTAVRWAAAEAADRGCPLHLVRVVEQPMVAMAAGWVPVMLGPDGAQRRQLEDELAAEIDRCRAHASDLEVHGVVHDGPPCSRLAEHAELVGANVLVVGDSGTGPASRFLHGVTGVELLHTTRRTVVVAREPTPVQEACVVTGYAPVVAAVDDAETAGSVLAFAFGAARRWGASVLVVHVDLAGADRTVPPAVLGDHLAALDRTYRDVPVRVETVTDHPARAVLDRASEARLVVAGDRRQSAVQRVLAGSISRAVLRRSPSPVAVVS
jgi:nucleotide-binding universal stress UspA family protein